MKGTTRIDQQGSVERYSEDRIRVIEEFCWAKAPCGPSNATKMRKHRVCILRMETGAYDCQRDLEGSWRVVERQQVVQ